MRLLRLSAMLLVVTMGFACKSNRLSGDRGGLGVDKSDDLYSFVMPLPKKQTESNLLNPELSTSSNSGAASSAPQTLLPPKTSVPMPPVKEIYPHYSGEEIRIVCGDFQVRPWDDLPINQPSQIYKEGDNEMPYHYGYDIGVGDPNPYPYYLDDYLTIILKVKVGDSFIELTRNTSYGCYDSAKIVIKGLQEKNVYRLVVEYVNGLSFLRGYSKDFTKSANTIDVVLKEAKEGTIVNIKFPEIVKPRPPVIDLPDNSFPEPNHKVQRKLSKKEIQSGQLTLKFLGTFIALTGDKKLVADVKTQAIADHTVITDGDTIKEHTNLTVSIKKNLKKGEYKLLVSRYTPYFYSKTDGKVLREGGKLVATEYTIIVE